MPPWSEVWDVLRSVLGPSLASAALVYGVLRFVGGERAAAWAAGIALLVGIGAGNLLREAMPWRIDAEQALTLQDWSTALIGAVTGAPGELPPPPRYWLPWLAVVTLAVELLSRVPRVPGLLGWTLRALVAALAGRLLTPLDTQQAQPGLLAVTAGVMLLNWLAAITLARRWRGAGPAIVAGLACALAAGVMLHAHSARLSDLALFPFAALMGIAAVAWRYPGDLGPALAPLALWLPGLAWAAHHETFSEVPTISIVLVGLAPLAWCLGCLPDHWRRGWLRVGLVGLAALLPVLIALGLAMRAVRLEF